MSTRNKRNKFDRNDSLELGQSAESRFASLARTSSWAVAEATRTGNIEDHYDFEISRGDRRYRVDVKSKKRISRKAG